MDAARLIDTAKGLARAGHTDRAWEVSAEAARIGRSLADALIIARAATAAGEPDLMSWRSAPARQALCFEALSLLGAADEDEAAETTALRDRVEAQLEVLSTGWAETFPPAGSLAADNAADMFAHLILEHERRLGPGHAAQWLEYGAQAVALGRIAGDPSMSARGRLWRMDAFLQLGLGLPLQHELSELAALVSATDSIAWRWRLALIHATTALRQDRIDDARLAAAQALDLGQHASSAESKFLDLVLRAEIASQSGEHVADVEREVQRAVEDAPLFAQGWRGQLLLRLGRVDEAVSVWRLLSPHIDAMPQATAEWLVATAGHAALAIAADDTAAIHKIRRLLLPFAHQHVAAPATTPYGGPVALVLAGLDRALNEPVRAATWATEALTRSESIGAAWHAARARAMLAGGGQRHEGLTPRESEIADLLATAKTNREIATALFLSERTVEQHVRNIMQKTELPNRAAIAVWAARRH